MSHEELVEYFKIHGYNALIEDSVVMVLLRPGEKIANEEPIILGILAKTNYNRSWGIRETTAKGEEINELQLVQDEENLS